MRLSPQKIAKCILAYAVKQGIEVSVNEQQKDGWVVLSVRIDPEDAPFAVHISTNEMLTPQGRFTVVDKESILQALYAGM